MTGSGKKYDADKPKLRLVPAAYWELETVSLLPACLSDLVRTYQSSLHLADFAGLAAVEEALRVFRTTEPDFLEGLVKALEYGLVKYSKPGTEDGEGSWRTVRNAVPRYLDAVLRHSVAMKDDEDAIDPESGLPHRYHRNCSLVFLLALLADG